MTESKNNNMLMNQRGTSSVETAVLIVIMIALVYYSFGFFGVVHTAILHNIHARTYTFETFRHRTNLMYFRENRELNLHYYNHRSRVHGIQHERDNNRGQIATERSIAMGLPLEEEGREDDEHNDLIRQQLQSESRNGDIGVNPIWITVMYGICFTEDCSRR